MLGTLIKQERLAQNISQKDLCCDICTTSYLSKIENGMVACSDEVYELLLKKMKIQFIQDDKLCSQIEDEFIQTLNTLRSVGYCSFNDMENPVSILCDKMRYSKQSIKSLLLFTLSRIFDNFTDISEKEIDRFDLVFSNLNTDERLLYAYIKSQYYQKNNEPKKSIHILTSIENVKEPWTLQAVGFHLYMEAAYQQAVEKYKVAYMGFAEIGCVKGMLDTARCIFSVHCNNLNFDEMLRWNNVIEQINIIVNDDEIACINKYNIGSTYLMYGDISQAIFFLTESEKHLTNESHLLSNNSLLLRLSFAFAINGELDEANKRHKSVNLDKLDGHWELSYQMIKCIIENSDYRNSIEYCNLLEECVLLASKETSKGFSQFYAHYLLDVYKSQRKYKKAIELYEKISFLNNAKNL